LYSESQLILKKCHSEASFDFTQDKFHTEESLKWHLYLLHHGDSSPPRNLPWACPEPFEGRSRRASAQNDKRRRHYAYDQCPISRPNMRILTLTIVVSNIKKIN